MSRTIRNFSLLNAVTTLLTATNVSQAETLDSRADADIMVINDSTSTIFVRTGDSTVVADATAMPILPGEKGVYDKGNTLGNTTTLSYFTETGSVPFRIIQGTGS